MPGRSTRNKGPRKEKISKADRTSTIIEINDELTRHDGVNCSRVIAAGELRRLRRAKIAPEFLIGRQPGFTWQDVEAVAGQRTKISATGAD